MNDKPSFVGDQAATWLDHWEPPGRLDMATGVHLGPSLEQASFPDEGIELFGDLDEESFWFVHRTAVILDELERAVGSHARVLEVGSGSGAVAAAMRHAGHEVMAVEPASGGAVRARQRGVHYAFEGTLHEADLPSDTFDAVGLFDVIEHLDGWSAVLRECARVLKPTGRLLVTVPAYQWLWSEHDDWNEHKRRYTRARLAHDLESAGFKVEHSSHLFLPLVAPAAVRRLHYLVSSRSVETHEQRLRGQLQPNGFVNKVLGSLLSIEQRLLDSGIVLPTGTSILSVARPTTGRHV